MVEQLQNPTPAELEALTALWEASVRATHGFLSEEDIPFFRQLVRNEALPGVNLYVIKETGIRKSGDASETGIGEYAETSGTRCGESGNASGSSGGKSVGAETKTRTEAEKARAHCGKSVGGGTGGEEAEDCCRKYGGSEVFGGFEVFGRFGGFIAFAGVAGEMLEMLFVAPGARGKGAGRQLVNHVTRHCGVRRVDVNEQNPLAAGFYERMGFRTTGRDAADPSGRPYPILHMTLGAAPQTGPVPLPSLLSDRIDIDFQTAISDTDTEKQP